MPITEQFDEEEREGEEKREEEDTTEDLHPCWSQSEALHAQPPPQTDGDFWWTMSWRERFHWAGGPAGPFSSSSRPTTSRR